jgi:hypothetical protein
LTIYGFISIYITIVDMLKEGGGDERSKRKRDYDSQGSSQLP